MYSLAGALIILLCGARLSVRICAGLSSECERLENYILLLRYIKSQIECFALPIREILCRADPRLMRGCGWGEDAPACSFDELLHKAEISDGEARAILLEFCKDFGNSYLDDQIRRCDHYVSLLEGRRDALFRDLPRRKKLCATLCISGALAVIILLI